MDNNDNYTKSFLKQISESINCIKSADIREIIDILVNVRTSKGRLFFVGVGGGAGNANHAVCDFRKLAKIETYSVSDNVSELTARVNDEGWDSSYSEWLKVSNLSDNDCVFVFSVGGGNLEKNVSTNIVQAIRYAKTKKTKIVGVVGKDGGYTAEVADAKIIVKVTDEMFTTPITETIQVLVWHLIITHPDILLGTMKW